MISEPTRKLLVASKVKGVGKRTLQHFASEQIFFELAHSAWHEEFPPLRALTPTSQALGNALEAAEQDIAWAERLGAHILSSKDSLYPALLRDVNDRPEILYVRGDPANFCEKAVAVVGTREPTRHGKLVAERITSYFVENNWQIVSGLAIGLDSIAHKTTVSKLGSTVAVMAQGLEETYPRQNALLAEQILEHNGLLVSEYPFGTASYPAHFVERDRIQAALAKGVVMVQSAENGGSWHASRAALRYGRWLMVPAPTTKDSEEGQPKARGNGVMAGDDLSAKLQILKCPAAALERLLILRSRADYPIAEHSMLALQA